MLDGIISTVRKAGNIILFAHDQEQAVSEKEGRSNFVTKYDTAVQSYLQEELLKLFPDAGFIGEEGDHEKHRDKECVFIVDPIDGTTNFIKKTKKSCVSVAFVRDEEVLYAVVYNPFMNEMFYAQKGRGAFLNGNPIHVSDGKLADELVCFGTSPYYPELIDDTFDLVKKLHMASLDLRRSGSAALDLCDVACGRIGLFFELRLSPWDYAAGSLIAEEAGGRISKLNGEKISLEEAGSVLAGNRNAFEDFFKDLKYFCPNIDNTNTR